MVRRTVFVVLVLALAAGSLAMASLGANGARARPTMGRCAGHTPTIRGTNRSDKLVGTPRRDVILGGDGADYIDGRGGGDIICGGGGEDRLLGGPGKDTLAGGPGRDKLFGGTGSDAVSGGRGVDSVFGGGGTDRIYGGASDDRLSPGKGNDAIFGGTGADRVMPGPGSSTITPDPVNGRSDPGDPANALGGDVVIPHPTAEQLLGPDADEEDLSRPITWADRVDPGPGDDTVVGSPGNDEVAASSGDDSISGGPGFDTLAGGEGNDTVDGGDGFTPEEPSAIDDFGGTQPSIPNLTQSTLSGGAGSDHIIGGAQRDVVDGGAGSDRIEVGDGNDTVVDPGGDNVFDGGGGNDDLVGGDGQDRIDAGGGDDRIDGGGGDDVLAGGDGKDTIAGAAGNDQADGGSGADSIDGGVGADGLSGSTGGDTLVGGPDDPSDSPDRLDGGESVDTLKGGGGADTLTGGDGTDVEFGQGGDDTLESGAGYDSAYGDAGTDRCVDAEQPFLCEQTSGTTDSGVLRDGPGPSGLCDAFAAPSGDDQASGALADPYRTAERLINALRPGETGCLQPGVTFEEPDFEMHVRSGGDPGNPVTLRTAPAGERATIRGRVWVDQAAHDVVFEDLNFDGENPLASLRGVGAALPSPTVDGDRISFFGTDVTTNHTATCFVVGSVLGFGVAEDVSITGSRIHDCGVTPDAGNPSGDNGIDLEASRNALVADNYIYDNGDKGILLYPDAQGSQIRDNVLDRNRINVHFGTAVSPGGDWTYPAGTKVMPENNPVTNNVITNSRLGLTDPDHWQVEGNKDWSGSPDPAGNLVDGNCTWHQDPTRDIQQPNVAFTEGSGNLAGPPALGPPQPASGPGYTNEGAKDFRLSGDADTCPQTSGPEDPPTITETVISGSLLQFTATDHSRGSGSTVYLEFRRVDSRTASTSDPIHIAPGETVTRTVPFPHVVLGANEDSLFRVVARGPSGYTYGGLHQSVADGVLGAHVRFGRDKPELGRTVNLIPASELVTARLTGIDSFYSFSEPYGGSVYAQVPTGTHVDARRDSVGIETIGRDGTLGLATVHGGVFSVTQAKTARDTTIRLSKKLRCAPPGSLRKARARRRNSIYARWRHRRRRHLTIRGHYASGSARGTRYLVQDRCDGTFVKVMEGVVEVRDFVRHRKLRVRAGHSYLARATR